MPHQRLHRGKEARAGGEILPAGVEISLVSVTGSVTWISHSPSVIGMNPDPRRQRDERHARR